MEWWGKVITPVRKVWIKVAKRVGLRKTGHVKLRRDVRSCEYQDVHILWEMLKRNETELGRAAAGGQKAHSWNFVDWARCAPFLCRTA